MDYRGIIAIEPGKRSGQPCIRSLRVTVYDVLDYLAAGMTQAEILDDFPYLTEQDIRACLAFAADRETHHQRRDPETPDRHPRTPRRTVRCLVSPALRWQCQLLSPRLKPRFVC